MDGEEGDMKYEVVNVLATTGAPVKTICHPGVDGQHGGEAGDGQRDGGCVGGPEEQAGHHASQLQRLVLCGEC